MSRDRLSRAEELFLQAADLDASEQDIFLRTMCGGDAELRNEVDSLLHHDNPSWDSMDRAVQEAAVSLSRNDFWIGQRIGAYRIRCELGVGGMGAVYQADRDDQRFDKQVAIKIIHQAMDTAGLRERLIDERRILAALDHPYIAKLIDGGETTDGTPYFVLEYVNGLPITRYAREGSLSSEARCQLMIRVCEGVSYAHRNLVIHRDLKPSNILVDTSGTPKLLDFGIAHLMDRDSSEASGPREYTPEYASPELAAGRPVATYADVYSLGVLLCELLTGSRTLAARAVSNDLEAIIRKATAEEPTDRYQSPDLLAADLRNTIRRYPVSARPATLAYQGRRFVARNKLSVILIAVLLCGLIAIAAIAVFQARRADQQRQIAETERGKAEARAAEAVQARERADREHTAADAARANAVGQAGIAEHRLEEFTALAGSTVSDLNDALERIPGATKDRRKIVADTLRFLDTMRASNPGNLPLLRTAADGYLRMARLLGAREAANLGDREGAKASLEKSSELAGQLLAQYPGDLQLQEIWIGIQSTRSDLLYFEGHHEEDVKLLSAAVAQAAGWRRASPRAISAAMGEAGLHAKLASHSTPQDKIDALKETQTAIDLLDPLHRAHPEDDLITLELADAWEARWGGLIHTKGDTVKEAAANGIRLREELLARRPEDVVLQRSLFVQYRDSATHSMIQGDLRTARTYNRRAVALATNLSAADPANAEARADLAGSSFSLGGLTPESPEEMQESIQALRRAVELREVILAGNPSAYEKNAMAEALDFLGRRLQATGDMNGAVANFERSLKLVQDALAQLPASNKYRLQNMRSAEAFLPFSAERWGRARAVAFAEELIPRATGYTANLNQRRALPLLLAAYGDMWEQQGDHAGACLWYREGEAAWKRLGSDASTRPGTNAVVEGPGWLPREFAALQVKLGRCPQ